MNESQTLWQKFTHLSRWMQWALIAAVALITYVAYSDYVWAIADDWNTQADAIEERIQVAHDMSRRLEGIASMSSLIRGLGPVEEPQRDINAARKALNQTVNTILKEHSVTNDDFRANQPLRLSEQTLDKLIKDTGNRVESLSGDLKFEASVKTTMAIISELESSPDIESISNVRLTKLSGTKKLSVRLTVVSWVYSPATRRSGGRLQ